MNRIPGAPTKKFLDETLEDIFEKAMHGMWPHSHLSAIGIREGGFCTQLGGIVYERPNLMSIVKEAPKDILTMPESPTTEVKWLLLVARMEMPCSLVVAGISHAKIVARRRRYMQEFGIVLTEKTEDVPDGDIALMMPLQKALYERETRDHRGHETGASQGEG